MRSRQTGKNRERRDEQEDETRERRTSARDHIEMKSGAESTDVDFLLRLANPPDPTDVRWGWCPFFRSEQLPL